MKDPAPHPGFPVSTTSMLIAAARRHLKQVIAGLVEPLGLSPHQFWALLLLREIGPQTLTDLAAHMWLDHPTTSRLVHALQDLGYLSIQPHPRQGRRVIIQIVPARRAEVDRLAERAEAFRAELEEGVAPEEKAAFREMMRKLLLNLEGLQIKYRPTRASRRDDL